MHVCLLIIHLLRKIPTCDIDFFMFPPNNENMPIQIYWKFYHQKNENFQIKILIVFLFLLKNTDCGYSLEPPRRGGYNEYPKSMFWADIRKIIYTPVNPTFTI